MVCLCLTSLWEYNGTGSLNCRHPVGESLFLQRGKERFRPASSVPIGIPKIGIHATKNCVKTYSFGFQKSYFRGGMQPLAARKPKWPPANGRRHRPFCSLRPPHAWPPCNRRKQKTKNLPSKCSLNPETMFGTVTAIAALHVHLPWLQHPVAIADFPMRYIGLADFLLHGFTRICGYPKKGGGSLGFPVNQGSP